jgi:hypothetical protein
MANMNMTDISSLKEFWDKIDHDSITHLNEHFSELAPYLIQFLVNSISEKERFEIYVYKDGWEKGSAVSYCEQHKQLELRSKTNSTFHLVLTISGVPGQKFSFKHKLSMLEEASLPLRLKRLMDSIKELGRPMTFYKGL